jgi:hypothetical protein
MKEREEWKRLILGLPDPEFFEIVRNYIGEVKTPFNKHELIDRTARLLGREDYRERLLDLITPEDAELLSAVWFLDSPSLEDLTTFFDSRRPYLELHHHLINLEQRLLVISDRSEKPVRLVLNPLLEKILLTRAVHPGFIFPPAENAGGPPPEPWISDLLIVSLLTYFAEDRNLLKNDGGIKKRYLDELKTLFPVLFEEEPCGLRLHLLLEVLANSGFLRQTESGFAAFPPAAEELEGLDRERRRLRLAAKAIPPKLAGRFEGERILKALLELLETGSYYPLETVERAVRGICLRNRWPLTNPGEIARRICSSGALAASASGERGGSPGVKSAGPLYRKTAPPAAAAAEDTSRGSKIVLQPTFTVTVKPELTLSEGMLLVRIAEVKRYDRYSEFEITKESFTRGLKSGLISTDIADRLEELSGAPLPQNLIFTFSTWEKEYRSISLYRGIVLTADEERRHLIEHDPMVQRYIRKTLGPGLYLLSEAEREGWEEALLGAGVAPLPAIEDFAPRKPRLPSLNALFPGEDRNESALPVVPPNPPPTVHGDDSLLEGLIGRVEKMDITPEEREELEARIRKRLILFEEQLVPGVVRSSDKAEAKGLDFIGKVRLIEQTLQSGSDLLEVIVRGSRGEPKRYLMKPRTIDRTGTELKLVGKVLPGEKEMSLQIRKLSLVRRLKSSLYSP